jgi:putative ATPase
VIQPGRDKKELFDQEAEAPAADQPLAARMRPRTLEEFAGQEHILGAGRLLRRAIQADQLSSLIFYGPPGTGKTTLAQVIAGTTRSRFVTINAVLAGVKEIRSISSEAAERKKFHDRRTILFVDEVHRWNKAQQDALLPWVENGTIIFIGATTENPYFEVNRALVSRSRIFQLEPLNETDLMRIARAALEDKVRGYGRFKVKIDPPALNHLVKVASGDARTLLNALELAVETTVERFPPPTGTRIHITLEVAEESIQRRVVLYDKEGDYHFDTISAFIKAVRGSDPDAALYWLAKMVYAGEDPRFIFRRLLILDCEDVGLADPQALMVTEAAARAFDRVGLPEGRFHLAQAALYLATAPKSNSSLAFFDALETVEKEAEGEVPNHLKDASRDREGFGHGEGYLYPHAYREHWVAQQYLPDRLQGKLFYQPGELGWEGGIREQVQRRREAQLEAMLEAEEAVRDPLGAAAGTRDLWMARTVGSRSEQLASLRDRVVGALKLQRHHLALVLNAGGGLLVWELQRRVPDGGVWALAESEASEQMLTIQGAGLSELERPKVISREGGLQETLAALAAQVQTAASPELTAGEKMRFDAAAGRNVLVREEKPREFFRLLAALLVPGGRISLAESLPAAGTRLSELVDLESLGGPEAARVREAESSLYGGENAPLGRSGDELRSAVTAAGFKLLEAEETELCYLRRISSQDLNRWFASEIRGGRESYARRLAEALSAAEIEAYRTLCRRTLADREVEWKTRVLFLVAEAADSAES